MVIIDYTLEHFIKNRLKLQKKHMNPSQLGAPIEPTGQTLGPNDTSKGNL